MTDTRIRVTMILCDHAQEVGGKLYILGGGWSRTTTPTGPSAVAVLFRVPWGDANRKLPFSLHLLDSDGQPVVQPNSAGSMSPVAVNGSVEVGRPPGLVEGSTLEAAIALNVPPMLLQPNAGYVWELKINGETEDDWRLPFQTVGVGTRPSN